MRHSRVELALFAVVAVLIGFLVLYPAAMMVRDSFGTDGTWTLAYWQRTLRLPILGEIVWNTMVVTIVATALAMVFGLGLAWIVARTDVPFGSWLENISVVPFLTPPVVAGFAWQLIAERQSGILNTALEAIGAPFRVDIMSLSGVTLVSALYLVPFVFLVAAGVLRTLSADLEDASSVVGANRWTTFRRITLPLLAPALSSAAVIAFSYSITLFGIHATLGMPVNIWFLTTQVYRAVNVIPSQLAEASVLVCMLMGFGVLATWVQLRLNLAGQRFQTVSGKGVRVKSASTGPWRWLLFALCAAYVFVAAVLPYVALLARSLKPYMFQPGMTWQDVFTGWDLSVYWTLFTGEDRVLTRALVNSFLLAVAASVICIGLTSVAAYIIERTRMRGRHTLSYLCIVPLTLPSVVLGIAILAAFGQRPFFLYGTIWILLVAYVVKDLPIGLKTIEASLIQIHHELDESARVCGASWLRQFGTITLPMLKPGLAIAFVLTFASTLREIGASILLYSEGNEVVAYVLFNQWENGDFQKLSAFIVVTTLVTLAVVATILRFGRLGFTNLANPQAQNR